MIREDRLTFLGSVRKRWLQIGVLAGASACATSPPAIAPPVGTKDEASEPTFFFPFDDTPERVTGRAAVDARFRRFFDQVRARGSGPPYLNLKPRELRVERYGDAGLVTFELGGPGGRMGRRTLLFVRENGAWRLSHLHAAVAGEPWSSDGTMVIFDRDVPFDDKVVPQLFIMRADGSGLRAVTGLTSSSSHAAWSRHR